MEAKHNAENCHDNPLVRERLIAQYLSRRLDAETAEQFESHYLVCQDCFEEVRAAEILIYSLGRSVVECDQTDGVTVIRFAAAAELTGRSSELATLAQMIEAQSDTKVLIDLSQVSRIDSTGLGTLMSCYAHAVRNSGVLKLLNPNSQVKRVLSMTHIDAVLPAFEDENAALRSFR